MATTLLLDPTSWDLVLDGGNIATVDNGYALAQTAANALRTWFAEPYYNQNQGVPYLQSIMGRPASLPMVQTLLTEAALSVAGVAAASVRLGTASDRHLAGTVYVADATGAITPAGFAAGLS